MICEFFVESLPEGKARPAVLIFKASNFLSTSRLNPIAKLLANTIADIMSKIVEREISAALEAPRIVIMTKGNAKTECMTFISAAKAASGRYTFIICRVAKVRDCGIVTDVLFLKNTETAKEIEAK